MLMKALNLPTYSFSIKSEGDRSHIFDSIRKKYVALTPEEWVRQHFIMYLVQDRGFPSSLISVEKEFSFNRMKKRTDILAHNRQGDPVMLVECKAPDVPVNAAVFDQIGLYNLTLNVPWLIVTNGMKHYCCRFDPITKGYGFTDHIPAWAEIQES
ncbi:MAG TPA: type I restriction enzyme HsdR N-terminal domain-containing protein [Bacteroides sp.]|nr:type I restriction enzyme HsdR N-terminal domain-containing protein [Bacteroides sp.]